MEKYLVVYGKYEGMEAAAVNMITAKISGYTNSPPTVVRADDVRADGLCGKDAVIIGTLSDNRLLTDKYRSVAGGDSEGYAVEVGECDGRNVIYIAANEMPGVYYGVVDLCRRMRSKSVRASETVRSGHGDTVSSTIINFSKTCRL